MNQNLTPIEQKTQADYDEIAGAFSGSRRNMQWPEVSAFLAGLPHGLSLLDVACGTGRICSQLGDKIHYTGLELSTRQIQEAKKNCPSGRFHQGSMLRLPFNDDTFDVVLDIAALHHLATKEERQKALSEAVRVLKPGGKLLVTTMGLWQPKHWKKFFAKKEGLKTTSKELRSQVAWNDVFIPWSWGAPHTVYRFYHAFSKGELKSLTESLPLEIEEIAYYKNGEKTHCLKGKNLVLIARKTL